MNKVRSGFVVAAATLLSLSLSGCSVLYPHWGATDFPTDSPAGTASSSPTPTSSASASPSVVPVQAAKVQLMQVNVDATAGVVDVVAQITNVSEDGGSCTLSVVSGSTR